jgi:hypothetical protein
VSAPPLVRFWFEFEAPTASRSYRRWVGVTAWTIEDAKRLVKENAFADLEELPPIIKMIENVDVSTLDANHVLRNMLPPNIRGIWYPMGLQLPPRQGKGNRHNL